MKNRPFRVAKTKTPFCRITKLSYEEDGEKIKYYHPTKGWRVRKYTSHLAQALMLR